MSFSRLQLSTRSFWRARTLHEIGVVKQRQGDYSKAAKLLRQSLEIKKELGSPHLIAVTLAQLGLLEEDLGNRQEAVKYLDQALAIFRRLDEKGYMKQAEEASRRLHAADNDFPQHSNN